MAQGSYEHLGTADAIELVEDERGFELVLTDENGDRHAFNVHHLTRELVQIGERCASYWREGERAAREHEADMARLEYEQSRGEALVGLGDFDGGSGG